MISTCSQSYKFTVSSTITLITGSPRQTQRNREELCDVTVGSRDAVAQVTAATVTGDATEQVSICWSGQTDIQML